MRNRRGIVPIAAIGIVIILFTAAAFFLLELERDSLHCQSLVSLLLSEFILFGGLIGLQLRSAKPSKAFQRAGVTAALVLYFIVTLFSVFFTGQFYGHENLFILMEITIFATFVVLTVSLLYFSRNIEAQDRAAADSLHFMEVCERRIGAMYAGNKNKSYAASLENAYESVHCADKTGASALDGQIDETLTILEDSLADGQTTKEDIASVLDALSSLLKRRKLDIAASKRGGF